MFVSIPFNLSTLSPITNNGTMLGSGIFTATFTLPATEYKLLDVTTGYYVRFVHNFVANDILVMDTDKQSAYLNVTTNALQYLDLTSRFFQIQLGTIYTTATPVDAQSTKLSLTEQYI
jgi:hypothetical protein